MAEPDYIIVGAGSAGAALADQLSADGRRQVLVLEAGPTHHNAFVTMPKGIGKVLGTPSRTWQYQTEAHDGIPAEHWIRGRMLGGSSALNGMMYFRAQQADYDDWGDQGATGWDGAEMARVFREMENHALAGEGRGTDGPLRVTIPESGAPLTEAFIAAGEQMGLQRVKDLNNPAQEGVGYAPHTISGGVRISSARAFLDRAAKRPNLRVVTGFAADRVVFDGVRAAGISGLLDGVPTEFRTAGEIILCAGAINSPAILQRSGVGDPARLNDLGIVTVAANPGVGEHLLEHRTLMLHYDLKSRLGENHEYRGLRLLANTLRYFATRGGLMAAPPYPASAFSAAVRGSIAPTRRSFSRLM